MSRLMVPLVALLPIVATGWFVLGPDDEEPSGVAIVFGDSLLFGADDQHSGSRIEWSPRGESNS